MGKADQSKEQAQSKSQHRAERFCGGRTCPNKMLGRVFAVIGQCCHRGLLLRRANGVRPYIYIVRSLEFVQ